MDGPGDTGEDAQTDAAAQGSRVEVEGETGRGRAPLYVAPRRRAQLLCWCAALRADWCRGPAYAQKMHGCRDDEQRKANCVEARICVEQREAT